MTSTTITRPAVWQQVDAPPPAWKQTLEEEIRLLLDPRTSSEFTGPRWIDQAKAAQRRRFGKNRFDTCASVHSNVSERTETLSDHTAACCREVAP